MSVLVLLKDIAPQYKSEDLNDYMLIVGGRIVGKYSVKPTHVITMKFKACHGSCRR